MLRVKVRRFFSGAYMSFVEWFSLSSLICAGLIVHVFTMMEVSRAIMKVIAKMKGRRR